MRMLRGLTLFFVFFGVLVSLGVVVVEASLLYSYETQHFKISYNKGELDPSPVPSGNTDGDGIPDYIEIMGEYLEYSFDITIHLCTRFHEFNVVLLS